MTIFNSSQFHSKAAEALDRAGESLIAQFAAHPWPSGPQEPFLTRLSNETITLLSVDPVSALIDFAQRTTGWAIGVGPRVRAGEGGTLPTPSAHRNDAQEAALSDRIFRLFLEKAVVAWCAERMPDQTGKSRSSHLLATSAEAFIEHVYLVPLSNVEIERDFTLGATRILTLDPTLFTATRDHARARRPDSPDAGQSVDRLLRDFATIARCSRLHRVLQGHGRPIDIPAFGRNVRKPGPHKIWRFAPIGQMRSKGRRH